MRLEVIDENSDLGYDFGRWLIGQIQIKFIASIDEKKLVVWDNFFNNNEEYRSLYNSPIVTKDILVSGIKCLVTLRTSDKIIIQLNPNQFIPNLDRVKVDAVFRLITFGTQSMKGYPVFTQVLQEFADNIEKYIEMYIEGF